jgi:transcriptional regulator with XRE-family HTH domain
MNRIRELRRKRGISQARLAAELSVHQTAVSQWETGRTEPDIVSAKIIADFFNVSLDFLLGHDVIVDPLSDVYMNLARGARDRKLILNQSDVDFILDFAQKLKARDERK